MYNAVDYAITTENIFAVFRPMRARDSVRNN